jgi:hypothetical protein
MAITPLRALPDQFAQDSHSVAPVFAWGEERSMHWLSHLGNTQTYWKQGNYWKLALMLL